MISMFAKFIHNLGHVSILILFIYFTIGKMAIELKAIGTKTCIKSNLTQMTSVKTRDKIFIQCVAQSSSMWGRYCACKVVDQIRIYLSPFVCI